MDNNRSVLIFKLCSTIDKQVNSKVYKLIVWITKYKNFFVFRKNSSIKTVQIL